MNSVLLDTSFLITFSDPARRNHDVARQYFRECVQRRVPMYLSAIVISEFQVKQAITDLPLRSFVVLPFNVDHAMRCGILARQFSRDDGDDRVRVKDDLKLIAQCDCEGISHLLCEDASTLAKYLLRAQAPGVPVTRCLLMKDGYDAAWFENGQKPLADDW